MKPRPPKNRLVKEGLLNPEFNLRKHKKLIQFYVVFILLAIGTGFLAVWVGDMLNDALRSLWGRFDYNMRY